MRRARARGVRFEAPAKGAALGSPRAGQTTRATVGGAAGRAAPALVTAILALAGATRVVQAPDLEAPLYLGLVLLGQAAGLGLSVTLDRPGARAYWQLALLATLVLMPIAAMQAAASRYPFVAISHGSAGPLLWLTLATLVALGAFWLFACYHSSAQPEESGLLFLLAALLVPAMLGAPGTIDERSVLAMLALAAGLAGIAIFISLLSPPSWRTAAGGVTLGAEFLLLWTLGRGPVIGQEAGAVVPVSAVLLLAVTVMLTVIAPLGAIICRRFLQTVEEESGRVAPAGASRGTRRQDFD